MKQSCEGLERGGEWSRVSHRDAWLRGGSLAYWAPLRQPRPREFQTPGQQPVAESRVRVASREGVGGALCHPGESRGAWPSGPASSPQHICHPHCMQNLEASSEEEGRQGGQVNSYPGRGFNRLGTGDGLLHLCP